MSGEVSQALAVAQSPQEALESRRYEPLAQTAPILNRSELEFFANMIDAAGLVPPERGVPPAVQKARVMAKSCAGVAHGFDPVSSQQNFHIIQGRIDLSARGMSIKLRRTGRYDVRIEKLDEEGCKLAVLHKNDEGKFVLKGYVEFTKAHADKAGLTSSNAAMYKKYGEDMFFANALKRVCRRFAPEVLDTEPVDFRLSRESAALYEPESRPAAPQIEAPQEVASENEVGAEWHDNDYQEGPSDIEVEAALGDDGFTEAEGAGEPVNDEDKELSERTDFIAAVSDLLNEKFTKAADMTKFLNGRVPKDLSTEDLQSLHAELLAL